MALLAGRRRSDMSDKPESPIKSTDVLPAQFNMPFDMVKESIEGNLRERMETLRNQV